MDYPAEIRIGDRSYDVEYEQVFSGNCSVRIRKKKVILKLSRFAVGKTRDEMVEKFLKWAEKKLASVGGDFIEPVYKDGGVIATHNKIYKLEVEIDSGRANSRAYLDCDVIKVIVPHFDADRIKFLAQKVVMDDQTSYLHEVVDELNQLYFQEVYYACRFKRMDSRFGSCSSKRNLNFAYKLLFAPREVFRYVCVHELAHLKEMNHSKRFWQHVEAAMPNYKEAEGWLSKNGFLLG
ncbi:hypothetical protein COU74_03760 [Candidatus Peregrinibacteria bacterium CG10_big_fil_rev_8_21_14_0_10_36_19]|nr:MAG: hypothetical protein COU74_03760 [Candidatus Peregrinibacteria bacterium CG10_big_fil_rev_8_21_14_0_10_36_19]